MTTFWPPPGPGPGTEPRPLPRRRVSTLLEGKRGNSNGMTLATRFRRRARGATSVTAALAVGLLVTICVPADAGAASAVAPGTYNTAEFNVPTGLAFGGGHLWVSNQAGNSLTEIDPLTGAVDGVLPGPSLRLQSSDGDHQRRSGSLRGQRDGLAERGAGQ